MVRFVSEAPDRTKWSGGLLSGVEGRALLIGAGLGLLVAVLLSLVSGSGYTGTALADGGPGGSVEAALDVSPDVANRYVQTELVYIGILAPAFEEAMSAAGLPPQPVEATQQGATNVIRLSTGGSDADQASRAANVALDVYIADWKKRTTADLQRLLENTNTRIDQVRAESEDLGNTAEDQAQRRGLLSELTRLTQERSDLQFRIGGVDAANRVVEQATPENSVRSVSLIQVALLGVIAGLALALAYIVFRRARALSRPESSG